MTGLGDLKVKIFAELCPSLKPETLVALPRILRTLERKGYRSVTIPELLALNPPSDQQVQAGFQGCVDAEHPSKAFTPTGSG